MKITALFILSFAICIQLSQAQQIELYYQSCTGCPQAANSNPAVSSALYQYAVRDSFEEQDIESDFDIRNAGGNTRWHKGLDLKDHGRGTGDQMRGEAIISPETGTIVRFQHQNYKYIVIDGATHDFGYGHIFSHNEVDNTTPAWRSGNFVLKMDLGVNGVPNTNLPAIINRDSSFKCVCVINLYASVGSSAGPWLGGRRPTGQGAAELRFLPIE